MATETQMTFSPFWLMIVSMAMAVLPVLRSPMMSSRWPRPTGIMLSIALMPVCNGSFPACRRAVPRGLELQRAAVRRLNHAFPVERSPQRVHHPPDHRFTTRHAQHFAGPSDLV